MGYEIFLTFSQKQGILVGGRSLWEWGKGGSVDTQGIIHVCLCVGSTCGASKLKQLASTSLLPRGHPVGDLSCPH